MANQPFFIVSGMFRSGSTLLAQMLQSHLTLAVASDPFRPLFKAFRNQIVNTTEPGKAFDHDAPFGDYYFSMREQVFFDAIQRASLDTRMTFLKLFTLQEQIRRASMNSAPKIHAYLETLQGDTYAELIQSGVNIVRESYGDENTTLTGFKEVWIHEFIPHILDQFEGTKAILLQRDPRAIAASLNVSREKYSWLFLARQWRKLSSLAWMFTQKSFRHHDRVLLLNYESMIRKPAETAEQICNFLEIPFHENLADVDHFIDGSGKLWTQNSGYRHGLLSFNKESLNKWKEVLSVRDCDFIERLCWPEMNLFHYEPVVMNNWVLPDELVNHPPLLAEQELAEWIKPFTINNKHAYVEELRKERRRWNALTDEREVDEDQKKAFCLDSRLYHELRAIARRPKTELRARVVEEE